MDNMQNAGANLTLCSTQVGFRFDCLASTLEMLFKDVDSRPDVERGWSPRRSMALGRVSTSSVARGT
eukprot:gene7675-31324_t